MYRRNMSCDTVWLGVVSEEQWLVWSHSHSNLNVVIGEDCLAQVPEVKSTPLKFC